jgi:hypothetical protein
VLDDDVERAAWPSQGAQIEEREMDRSVQRLFKRQPAELLAIVLSALKERGTTLTRGDARLGLPPSLVDDVAE